MALGQPPRSKMALGQPPRSLDDMLQADRKKRKAEALADKIFGKKSKQSEPSSGRTTPTPGASLASRMGVTKRSVSSSSATRQRSSAKPFPQSALSRSSTVSRLENAVVQNGTSQPAPRPSKLHINGSARQDVAGEISIRGAAGPYTVMASNFAPGTTAADIESVMQPVGGDMLSCKLAASNPTVIAEMVFVDRTGADNVIATFNSKKADGRTLHVFMKDGGGAITQPTRKAAPPPAPVVVAEPVVEDLTMEVEDDVQEVAYKEERKREDDVRARRDDRPYHRDVDERDRRPYQQDDRRRAAHPAHQDNRYGPGQAPYAPRYEPRRQDDWHGGGRMYSDNMTRRPNGRGGRW